jgi:hypothetical protein
VKRRKVLMLGSAALVLPAATIRVAAASQTATAGVALFDSRYPQSAAIAAGCGGSAALLDLHGADPVRLWRERLLPMMDVGATISGCSTYSAWHILRYSALEARHRPLLLRQSAIRGTTATLVTWQLMPLKRQG